MQETWCSKFDHFEFKDYECISYPDTQVRSINAHRKGMTFLIRKGFQTYFEDLNFKKSNKHGWTQWGKLKCNASEIALLITYMPA